MKKKKIPEGAESIVTYKWDFKLEEYVLVKRELVERGEGEKEDGLTGPEKTT